MIEQLDKNELLAMLHKRCSRCGVVKYFGEFSKQAKCAGGVDSQCRQCKNENARRRYRKDPDKHIAKAKDYDDSKRREANERKRRYRMRNRKRQAEWLSIWRVRNKDKAQCNYRARRARKANASGTHSAEQVRARFDYYGNKCIYCGSNESLEVEHRIPLSRGGSDWPANLAPACKSCNCSKHAKTETEFKKILEERNE
jgi:5-methylcytosine-specific restriction endonuclease McrA